MELQQLSSKQPPTLCGTLQPDKRQARQERRLRRSFDSSEIVEIATEGIGIGIGIAIGIAIRSESRRRQWTSAACLTAVEIHLCRIS